MTTLIAVYNSDGCVGRCDARCYNAHDDVCECICNGKNHGAGKDRAMDNTRAMAEEWMQAYGHKMQLGQDARWDVPARQLALI